MCVIIRASKHKTVHIAATAKIDLPRRVHFVLFFLWTPWLYHKSEQSQHENVNFLNFCMLHKFKRWTMDTFYTRFIQLCNEAGKTPSAVATDTGIAKSGALAAWSWRSSTCCRCIRSSGGIKKAPARRTAPGVCKRVPLPAPKASARGTGLWRHYTTFRTKEKAPQTIAVVYRGSCVNPQIHAENTLNQLAGNLPQSIKWLLYRVYLRMIHLRNCGLRVTIPARFITIKARPPAATVF